MVCFTVCLCLFISPDLDGFTIYTGTGHPRYVSRYVSRSQKWIDMFHDMFVHESGLRRARYVRAQGRTQNSIKLIRTDSDTLRRARSSERWTDRSIIRRRSLVFGVWCGCGWCSLTAGPTRTGALGVPRGFALRVGHVWQERRRSTRVERLAAAGPVRALYGHRPGR
jgi:hypothetical protein